MALSNFRPNPNNPIPNNPFSSPETSFLNGDQGKLIVGTGLTVNYATGYIGAGGGGGAVSQVTGGPGVSVSPTTGNVVVTNTGVLELTAGTGVNITGTKTNYTITTVNNGTVTSVTAGTGLTGGTITSTGTLSVDGSLVVLKSLYTEKGQILVSTAAGVVAPLSSSGVPNGYVLTTDSTSSTGVKWGAIPPAVTAVTGTAPISVTAGTAPVVSVSTATTSASGVTTLVNDLLTNDPTKALTAAQGYSLQQQIDSLSLSTNLTFAGTLNATTGNLLTVTTEGSSAGFAVGSPLPAASLSNKDYFVIATTPGTYTPPGGSATTVTQGDWFSSTGTAWNFLNVGYDSPAATTTTAGIVVLATNAEAISGTNSSKALTPAAAASAYVPLACLTAKGTIVTASGAATPFALPVGTNGQILTACSTCTGGLTWASAGPAAIPCACISAKGDIIAGSGPNSPTALSVGANGLFLAACSTATTGLCWIAPPYIPCSCITAKGTLVSGVGVGAPSPLPVGSDGQVLTACSACISGLYWSSPAAAAIPCACITGKGSLITGSSAGNPVPLAAGGNGTILSSNSLCTNGLEWITYVPAIPCACLTAKGSIVSATAANTPSETTVGTNGQVLTACSTCATGLTWSTPVAAIPCACVTGKGALITGSAANTPVALPVGANNQILAVDSSAPNGICWCTPSFIPCSIVTAKGGVIGGSAANTPVYQGPAPADGCILSACAACPSGLNWVCPPTTATPNRFGLLQGYTCSTSGNAFLGQQAGLFSLTTACQTVAIGQSSLGGIVAAASCCDTFVGACVASANAYSSGNRNVAIGHSSLLCLGANAARNTAVGASIHSTGTALTGCGNLILGAGINLPSSTGSCQMALGFTNPAVAGSSCYWLTGCSDQTVRFAKGVRDCDDNVGTAQSSTAGSILYSMGANGVRWGAPPLAALFCVGGFYGCQGSSGLAVGLNTGNQAAGVGGTAFGDAVIVGVDSAGISGDLNGSTVVGSGSAAGSSFYWCTTIVGSNSHLNTSAVTLDGVTSVGACSGLDNEGSYNTYIGYRAASALPYTGCNNIVIGSEAEPAAINSSNSVTLGNASITTIRAAVTSITSLSDARDKTNVQDLQVGLDFVKDLHPVSFEWKHREGNQAKDGTKDSGFIAQELKETQEKHNATYLGLVNTENPERYEATPGKLIPVLVNALRELVESHEELRREFEEYKNTHP